VTFPQRPAAGETHVWIVDSTLLDPYGGPLRALAGDDSPRALGRGFLRVLLGAYFGEAPDEVVVGRRCPACGGPHGPPTAHELRISVSYARGRVAYALANDAVGIDIELMRPGFPWRRVAPLALDAAAIERVEREPRAATAFLEAWTRREAIGKATGVGLIEPLPPASPYRVERIPTEGPYVTAVARAAGPLRLYAPIADAEPISVDR
jgi:4'-phosphopantetheinyl transferase superfamily